MYNIRESTTADPPLSDGIKSVSISNGSIAIPLAQASTFESSEDKETDTKQELSSS